MGLLSIYRILSNQFMSNLCASTSVVTLVRHLDKTDGAVGYFLFRFLNQSNYSSFAWQAILPNHSIRLFFGLLLSLRQMPCEGLSIPRLNDFRYDVKSFFKSGC